MILLVIRRWQETFALLTLAVAALSKVQIFFRACGTGGVVIYGDFMGFIGINGDLIGINGDLMVINGD